MQVQAITKNVRMSAQNMREVVRQIQGLPAAQAAAVLAVLVLLLWREIGRRDEQQQGQVLTGAHDPRQADTGDEQRQRQAGERGAEPREPPGVRRGRHEQRQERQDAAGDRRW